MHKRVEVVCLPLSRTWGHCIITACKVTQCPVKVIPAAKSFAYNADGLHGHGSVCGYGHEYIGPQYTAVAFLVLLSAE